MAGLDGGRAFRQHLGHQLARAAFDALGAQDRRHTRRHQRRGLGKRPTQMLRRDGQQHGIGARRLGQILGRRDRFGQADAGQIGRVLVALLHGLHGPGLARPQRDAAAGPGRNQSECRTPTASPDHADVTISR